MTNHTNREDNERIQSQHGHEYLCPAGVLLEPQDAAEELLEELCIRTSDDRPNPHVLDHP